MKDEYDLYNTNLEYIYVWLSQIEEINYMLYIRLIKNFKSVKNIYVLSKNKKAFVDILVQNNLILSNSLINKFTSFFLKEKSIKIYENLKEQKINIIHIESKKYPKEKFINMYDMPICLFVHGNIDMLNNKIIYLHKEEFNSYGKKIYNLLYKYIIQKKWNIVRYKENYEIGEEVLEKCIYVLTQNLFNENFVLKRQNNINKNIEVLYIFVPNNFKDGIKDTLKDKIYLLEMLVGISNICIIPQAKYNKNMYVKTLVEIFLEQEKSVLVIPGNIYEKFNYFSNYLIKEGAEVLLSKYDIDKYM